MEFKIYLRRFAKIIELYKLNRTAGGLYIWSSRSKDYISYHEDGRYWSRFNGVKTTKKLRQPLSSFKGVETLSVSFSAVFAPMPHDRDEAAVSRKPDDIVIELEGNVCVEIMLSADVISLPELPGRLNSSVHIKAEWRPIVVVETFQARDNVFPVYRYPGSTPWIEGVNFFLNHTGRI